ncbi:MAG TPA: SRPBCC family protein [Polyangiaceae bacterium]|jgi:uncharacterized protein YndB with AHSA1/START domain
MNDSALTHSTFTLERTYGSASPARVFAAFADGAIKRRWHAEGHGSNVLEYKSDFRVGGQEKTRFAFTGGPPGAPPPGTLIGNDTTYLDIVPNERIVFAYVMTVGDYRMSASLATVTLHPAGSGGTKLVFTEQGTYFDRSDGAKMREGGWTELLEKLENELTQK